MDFDAFLGTLPYMLNGMLGVFSVAAVMILSIVGLNRIGGGKKDKHRD